MYLCHSSVLSSTFDAACLAAKQLKETYPMWILFLWTCCRQLSEWGLLCERMVENFKKRLDINQNAADLNEMRHHITAIGVINDLDVLKRGGRISPTIAFIGGMLNFKPIILVKDDGTLEMSAKTIGVRKALKYMFNLFDETQLEF